MKCFFAGCVFLLILSVLPAVSFAGRLAVYIEPFTAAGANDKQMPASLQNLLGSRLDNQAVQVLDQPEGAQIIIKGTYTELGKAFSLDVTARNASGVAITKAFEQGQGQEEVLTALTKLGEKLSALLVAATPQGQAKAASEEIIRLDKVAPPPTADTGIIKADGKTGFLQSAATGQRLTGIYTGMAHLKTLQGGGRELVLLQDKRLQVVRHGLKTEQLDQVLLGENEKALTVDTADLDGDGQSEIYLTVMQEEALASQVWEFRDQRLVKIADKQPYFFRALDTAGRRTVYVQQMGRNDDFYGQVSELIKGPKGFATQNPVKLPPFGNVFNFNRFLDKEGKQLFVVLHPDGFLTVLAESGEELWRSNDKYGGSQTYFHRNDQQNLQYTGTALRKVFLEQRITVRKNGEIVVPANVGFWVVGNNRSYSKNSVHAFRWTGVDLEERWHTKVSQNYLADYNLDEPGNKLLLLEVVKKEGVLEKGASSITIREID